MKNRTDPRKWHVPAEATKAEVVQIFAASRTSGCEDRAGTRRAARAGTARSIVVFGSSRDRLAFITAIRAFALAGRWGDRLTLIGVGPRRRQLEKWAAALRIDHVVAFAESDPGIADSVVRHDVAILVSPEPEAVRVVLSGLREGMRVLASKENVAAARLLAEVSPSVVFPPYDVLALSHAMVSVTEPDPAAVQRALAPYLSEGQECAPAIRLNNPSSGSPGEH